MTENEKMLENMISTIDDVILRLKSIRLGIDGSFRAQDRLQYLKWAIENIADKLVASTRNNNE